MKTKNFFLTAASLSLVIQLTSCVTKSRIAVVDTAVQIQDLQTTGAQLTAAAESVSNSLKELAKIDRATHPQQKLPDPVNPEIIGMGQLGSIDWSGPVEPLVRKIAEATSYKLRVLGSSPAIPILISISAVDTTLADILRDVMFQCGNKANIVTYPASKVIELRYTK